MTVLSKSRAFIRLFPIARGMLSYAAIWPASSLFQQMIAGTDIHDLNYNRAFRFGLYGCFYVAPTLYCWIRITTKLWPVNTLKTAVTKAVVEQFSYGPFAITSFFIGMTLLEGRGMEDAKHEWQEKFLPTYQVGWCVWPIVQTINHGWVKERNKVPFISMCSLGWTCFLAYMHQIKAQKENAPIEQKK